MQTFSLLLSLTATLVGMHAAGAEYLRSTPETGLIPCDYGTPCLCNITNREYQTKVVFSCNASTEIKLGNLEIVAIHPHALDNMPQLQSLDVGANSLSEFPKQLLANKPNLETLDISGNQITYYPEDLFSGAPALKKLSIGGNPIRSIPENLLMYLPNLETLGMGSMMLTTLPENALKNQQKLKIFLNRLADGNSFTTLPEALFSSLHSLEVVSLSEGELETIPAKLFSFLGATIHTIDISGNNLKTLEQGTFDGLTHLRVLDVDTNKISHLPSNLFKDNKDLAELDLSSNNLKMLPENIFTPLKIEGHVGYPFLTLSRNDLNTLPEGIFSTVDASLIELCVVPETTNPGCSKANCPEGSTYEPIKASADQKFCMTKT